jgi:hypothetical protein
MKDGRKLIGELGRLRPGSVYFRAHNLLTSGDGTPALKWGSTGAYRENAQGRPVYDWAIVDRIFDTYLERGVKPYVQIGFMPKELSVKPEPYQHRWTPTARYDEIYTGWAYPPKDYAKWAELVVLGDLERGQHRLLARHARGVPQAARLRRRRREAGPTDGPGRRRRIRRQRRQVDPGLPGALPARDQPRHRQGRNADRLRLVPLQGRPDLRGRPRPDGDRQPAADH